MMDLLTESLKEIFKKRDDSSHKGNFGHALIIGGSENYVGAPQFSLSSAEQIISSLSNSVMFSGAGTSAVLVPDFLKEPLYSNIKYSAIYSCKTSDGVIKYDQSILSGLMSKTTCCALGMGMGNGDSDKIAEYILDNTSSYLVVDADALNKCSSMKFSGRAVLTPHIGEFSRMTGISIEMLLKDPVKFAKEFAWEHDCILVLKSHESVITDGEIVHINKTGNAKLSKGGSGDVLSGIICGLLSFSKNPLYSAVAGSYILGRCAELTRVNEFSCMPADIVNEIPGTISEIISKYNI